MSWTRAILNIQQIDLEMDECRLQLKRVKTKLEDDKVLREALQETEQLEAEAASARKAQKELEFELGQVEAERKQMEVRLYGGGIRNPRELADMQAKVQSLKRRQSQLEERVLEAMMAAEEAQARAAESRSGTAKLAKQWEEEHASLLQEQETLQATITRLEHELAEIQPTVPDSIWSSYIYLRKRRGGMVVARLQRESCSVCGVRVTSGRLQGARAAQEVYCDSCGCLLVA